jgi:hypothetical protein
VEGVVWVVGIEALFERIPLLFPARGSIMAVLWWPYPPFLEHLYQQKQECHGRESKPESI